MPQHSWSFHNNWCHNILIENLLFRGGICLWSASYPGNIPSVKSGVTSSSFGAFPRGSSGQWILVDVLRGSSTELVSALSWKPDGRYPLFIFAVAHVEGYCWFYLSCLKTKTTSKELQATCEFHISRFGR
jgi:hypothetical protein